MTVSATVAQNPENPSAPPHEQAPNAAGEDPGLQALRVARHDFKTPLTSLKMLGQIFKMGLEKGTLATQAERTERNCQLLIDQVDKLVQLADNLYEVSVAQSGRLKLERQLSDLRPVIQGVLTKFEAKISDARMPDDPIWGEWDTARLFQAFSNLIAEADSVDVAIKPDPRSASVVVSLKGEFRPDSERSSPGRYIAHVIVEKHGGRIDDRYEVTLPTAAPSSKQ